MDEGTTTMGTEPTVFVVDDEPIIRTSLERLMQSVSLKVETFATASEFLDAYTTGQPGCVVLDVRMPGISGLDLQDRMAERGVDIPIIFITAYGDVPMAVRALKGGAVDFLQKPYNNQTLLDRVQEAIEKDVRARSERAKHDDLAALFGELTPREHEVMDMVVAGKANREIAVALGLSAKTIEVHRAHVMRKLKVDSLADLVRLYLAYRKSA
ncbi:MAG TPA: response regulator transcription factor [Phycisphaerae bacterium]|nr:response regulator transcription factor [Phycisphaerae bacterium]